MSPLLGQGTAVTRGVAFSRPGQRYLMRALGDVASSLLLYETFGHNRTEKVELERVDDGDRVVWSVTLPGSPTALAMSADWVVLGYDGELMALTMASGGTEAMQSLMWRAEALRPCALAVREDDLILGTANGHLFLARIEH